MIHLSLAGPGRRSAPGCWRGCSTCRSSAATTPSSRPTPACAPARQQLEALATIALAKFYGECDVVLSPSPATDERLRGLGIAEQRIGRWDRGVDLERFDPALRDAESPSRASSRSSTPARLTKEKGVELLADAFLAARRARPAAAPRARRRRPRGGAAARAPRRARDLPRLARRRGPRAGVRERGRVPVRQPDRYLRAGDRRGAGQRAAGAWRSPKAGRCR